MVSALPDIPAERIVGRGIGPRWRGGGRGYCAEPPAVAAKSPPFTNVESAGVRAGRLARARDLVVERAVAVVAAEDVVMLAGGAGAAHRGGAASAEVVAAIGP